jgi:hypothetical protein
METCDPGQRLNLQPLSRSPTRFRMAAICINSIHASFIKFDADYAALLWYPSVILNSRRTPDARYPGGSSEDCFVAAVY